MFDLNRSELIDELRLCIQLHGLLWHCCHITIQICRQKNTCIKMFLLVLCTSCLRAQMCPCAKLDFPGAQPYLQPNAINTNTSEVTTVWRYINLITVVINIIMMPPTTCISITTRIGFKLALARCHALNIEPWQLKNTHSQHLRYGDHGTASARV